MESIQWMIIVIFPVYPLKLNLVYPPLSAISLLRPVRTVIEIHGWRDAPLQPPLHDHYQDEEEDHFHFHHSLEREIYFFSVKKIQVFLSKEIQVFCQKKSRLFSKNKSRFSLKRDLGFLSQLFGFMLQCIPGLGKWGKITLN